jgi:CRP/FNR family transcriptional regulator, dissimilatory nitrate respiration regulator
MGDNRPMPVTVDEIDAVLRATPVCQKLAPEDRRKVAEVAAVRRYSKGQVIFEQGTASFYTIASGRVKIFRMLPTGKDVILEVFGTGDPVGALAAYDGRPFPASAAALEDTACVVIPRPVFFRLLEDHPSLVRGLMLGLTHRRWGKQAIVRTEKDGFVVIDRDTLESVAAE